MRPASSLLDLAVSQEVKTYSKLIAVLLAVVRAPMNKWDVADRAMDSTARTIRLVAILVASTLQTAVIAALTYFLTHR
jgi:predicted secreted protein